MKDYSRSIVKCMGRILESKMFLNTMMGLAIALLILVAVVPGWFKVRAYFSDSSGENSLPSYLRLELDVFRNESMLNGRDISALHKVRFAFVPGWAAANWAGSCTHVGKVNLITIRDIGPRGNKNTLWRELGHCVLGYQHSDNKQSIMFSADDGRELNWELAKKEYWLSGDSRN